MFSYLMFFLHVLLAFPLVAFAWPHGLTHAATLFTILCIQYQRQAACGINPSYISLVLNNV